MTKTAGLTICSFNYIPKALVLLESYHSFHPDHSLFILIVDKKRPDFTFSAAYINIIWVQDLVVENFYKYAFCFDVIELNTNVKPMAMKHLLKEHTKVIYLDPDIQIFSRLDLVIEELNSASIVITPHSYTPILDGYKPDDADLLRFGAYNLGFIGVSKCDEADLFLDWWSDRCLNLGYYEPHAGLAVDQKWMDLAPAFFPGLKILRNVGLNVAFWNLHERQLSKIDNSWFVNKNTPLVFFHFSSFNVTSPEAIAYKQTRYASGSRPDFVLLSKTYSEQLIKFGSEKYEKEKYGFDYFDDGIYINPTLRRFYSILEGEFFSEENPFLATSKIRKFALKNHLLKLNRDSPKRLTFKDLDKFGRQETFFLWGLKFCLAILGPNRYYALMRYMAHISSIRNQRKLF
ncbi:MAG: glycosyl transferase [Bacteroidota bacterium]